MSGLGWVDGAFAEGEALPPTRSSGVGAFETLRAVRGELPLWDRHLARLAAAAERLGIELEPPAELRARARELLQRCGHGDDILRITLSLGANARSSWMLTSRARPASGTVRLHPVRAAYRAGDPNAGFKSIERGFYEAALAEARAAGADDALLVDEDGRLLETTTANLFVAVGGELWTPPLDGRIVPGIARATLLEGLAEARRPAVERPIGEADLAAAEALWVTNAVHGPRPGLLAGGRPGGAATAASPLTEIWRTALADASA